MAMGVVGRLGAAPWSWSPLCEGRGWEVGDLSRALKPAGKSCYPPPRVRNTQPMPWHTGFFLSGARQSLPIYTYRS